MSSVPYIPAKRTWVSKLFGCFYPPKIWVRSAGWAVFTRQRIRDIPPLSGVLCYPGLSSDDSAGNSVAIRHTAASPTQTTAQAQQDRLFNTFLILDCSPVGTSSEYPSTICSCTMGMSVDRDPAIQLSNHDNVSGIGFSGMSVDIVMLVMEWLCFQDVIAHGQVSPIG